ncbi:MAG TPA: MFS transporter [Gaiellaceae bacterium]|nr:MFS transporter [Gaiellaceae bacterium]
MSDPVFDLPRELATTPVPRESAFRLLRRRDFRTLFLAVSVSELGDAVQYIALMWFALQKAGPLGVVAVRLADSLPAFFFGLHGGLAADRWSRKKLMIGSDLVRAAVLVPVAVAGLSGSLPLWGLVVAAFLLEAATSYFAPAYGATIPTLVDRENVQSANALVQATTQALSVGGWALAAVLLTFMPVSTFFAVDASSFFISALLIMRLPARAARSAEAVAPRVREGIAALKPFPALSIGVFAMGIAMTITTGTWIGGVPTFIQKTLHHGASGFSLVMIGFAIGSIVVGAVLARVPVKNKARASLWAWAIYLPAYGLIAFATSLPMAFAGAVGSGLGESASLVLLDSAAQEDAPDHVLGRVLGLISLVHRGAHATGLLLVSPLFAVLPAREVFAAAAIAVPLVGLGGVVLASRATRTAALGTP